MKLLEELLKLLDFPNYIIEEFYTNNNIFHVWLKQNERKILMKLVPMLNAETIYIYVYYDNEPKREFVTYNTIISKSELKMLMPTIYEKYVEAMLVIKNIIDTNMI